MKKIISMALLLSVLLAGWTIPSAAEANNDGVYYIYNPSWRITASSVFGENIPERAFDDNTATFWHSSYKAEGSTIVSHDEAPFQITVVFPEDTVISGFAYTPRPEGSASGRAINYNFYIASSEEEEPILAMSGQFENNTAVKSVNLPCNVPVKKAVFEITKGINGYGTMSEFDFCIPKTDNDTIAVSEYKKYQDDHLIYAIDKSGFKANSLSEWTDSYTARNAIDDNKASCWHEKPGDKAPIVLEIDMGEKLEVAGFSYFPRQEAELKGHWKLYDLYVSDDGENYTPVLTNATMELTFDEKMIYFDSPVSGRYFEFTINDFNYHCACAELNFYQSKAAKDKEDAEAYEKYVMQIGSNILKATKGTEAEREVTLDVAPYLDNGTTLIPLRGLLTEMGAEISWNGDNQMVEVVKGPIDILFQIMNTRVFVTDYKYGKVRYTLKGSAPKIKNDRTVIPLRFVSENLGYKVEWDGANQTITIYYSPNQDTADKNN